MSTSATLELYGTEVEDISGFETHTKLPLLVLGFFMELVDCYKKKTLVLMLNKLVNFLLR